MDVYTISKEVQNEGTEVIEVWTKNGDEAVERASSLQEKHDGAFAADEEDKAVRIFVQHWKVTPKVPSLQPKLLYEGKEPFEAKDVKGTLLQTFMKDAPPKQAIQKDHGLVTDLFKPNEAQEALGLIPLGQVQIPQTPVEYAAILDMSGVQE